MLRGGDDDLPALVPGLGKDLGDVVSSRLGDLLHPDGLEGGVGDVGALVACWLFQVAGSLGVDGWRASLVLPGTAPAIR